jgi:glycine cleavage system H lipoate-binding protein
MRRAARLLRWYEGEASKTREVSFMTAILVVLTIVAFLAVDVVRSRKRSVRVAAVRRALGEASSSEIFARDAGVFYGSGHTWARLEPDGAVRVGIDDFAQRLIGRIESIEAAPAGSALGRTDAAFVVHQGDKTAAFAPPLEGVVTEVNAAVLRDPSSARRDPYGSGWLLRIEPKRLAHDLRDLRVADEARAWMREEMARLRDFVALRMAEPAVGTTMQDGGLAVDGLLEHLDEKSWERFESEFLAS